jgi:hypothetical protein
VRTVATNGWPVHFAGNTVRFNSNHIGILKAVETHFKYCLGEDGPVVADYEITTMSETDFSVSFNGSVLFSNINSDQVLWHLMQNSITQLNGASRMGIVLHAAALSHLDDGLILCGQSGCGKSSLAAWLVANGIQYLTDEVIMFPINGGETSGLCRSIILKSGSAFLWKRWLGKGESDGFHHFKDGSVWITPTLLNAHAVRASVTPYILIFPHYTPEARFSVQRLTTADALFRLLQCLVNARNFSDGGMTATTRLAKQVTAYSLTYSDIEHAAQWIKQIISAG